MALQGQIPIEFGMVFPAGAYAAGSIEMVRDFDRSSGDRVVQQVDKPDEYVVWSADDPDPPQVSLQLQPNHTYLVCVRMVHAMFLDCTHQTRGILAERITLTLTQDRPPETAADRVAPGPVALTAADSTPGSRPR